MATFYSTTLLRQQVSQVLAHEKQAQAQDDEVERRIEALLAVGGKYDLREQTNIEEAITEAKPLFWQAMTAAQDSPAMLGTIIKREIRSYYYNKAKEYVEEELDDERMRAQNPELVNRDE